MAGDHLADAEQAHLHARRLDRQLQPHLPEYRALFRVFLQAVMACFVANAKRIGKLEACA